MDTCEACGKRCETGESCAFPQLQIATVVYQRLVGALAVPRLRRSQWRRAPFPLRSRSVSVVRGQVNGLQLSARDGRLK